MAKDDCGIFNKRNKSMRSKVNIITTLLEMEFLNIYEMIIRNKMLLTVLGKVILSLVTTD